MSVVFRRYYVSFYKKGYNCCDDHFVSKHDKNYWKLDDDKKAQIENYFKSKKPPRNVPPWELTIEEDSKGTIINIKEK